MKDMRLFDGIITEQASGRQMDQTRLSFLGWIAGLTRGKLTNIAVGSYHVIRLQESVSLIDEVTQIATKEFHNYHGADQLIWFRKYNFEPGGVMTKTAISGTSNQETFGLKFLMIRSMFRRTPKHGKSTYTRASAQMSNTTAKRRGVARSLLGHFKETAELNDVDNIGG